MSDPTATGLHLGETPLLRTVGLTKRYGDFLANEAINIDIWPQQIHALLGENGAGKSTLVKIIYGLIQPSDGEMRWRGEKMVLSGPSEARARGIGMVFQHFSLFDNLTVAENVALGLDGKESFKDMSARLEQVSRVYGLPLDPKRQVWQLSVGERQRIEIVRALMQNPKFLILDEPTAVLTPQEADQLFIVLDRLKAEGRAVLYISHKLEEVKRLCDTATILRAGRKIATCNPQAETAAEPQTEAVEILQEAPGLPKPFIGLPIKFDDVRMAYTVGSVALGLILFDGGLRTRLATFRNVLAPAGLLATVGVLITATLTAPVASWMLGLTWSEALLAMAIFPPVRALLLRLFGAKISGSVTIEDIRLMNLHRAGGLVRHEGGPPSWLLVRVPGRPALAAGRRAPLD